MKIEEKRRAKIISGSTPEEFEDNYNKIMNSIHGQDIQEDLISEGNGLITVLTRYTESEEVPENIEDELQIRGLAIKCIDCPYLQIGKDKRRKWWPCASEKYHSSTPDSPACNKFYEDFIKFFYAYQKKRNGSTKQLGDKSAAIFLTSNE